MVRFTEAEMRRILEYQDKLQEELRGVKLTRSQTLRALIFKGISAYAEESKAAG